MLLFLLSLQPSLQAQLLDCLYQFCWLCLLCIGCVRRTRAATHWMNHAKIITHTQRPQTRSSMLEHHGSHLNHYFSYNVPSSCTYCCCCYCSSHSCYYYYYYQLLLFLLLLLLSLLQKVPNCFLEAGTIFWQTVTNIFMKPFYLFKLVENFLYNKCECSEYVWLCVERVLKYEKWMEE